MKIELRDYQKECVDTIDKQGSTGRHIVAMATGLGKTAVFTNIKRKGRTLILSHRDELVRQPEQFYTDCTFGVEKADEHSNGEDIVSASVQTLSNDNRLSAFSPDDFYTIIVDEAHHAAAPSYRKVLDYFTGAKQVIGVTATPKRGDCVRLSDVFDDIIFSRDLRWGIQNGWLSGIRSERIMANYNLSGVKRTKGDFSVSDLDAHMGSEVMAVAAKAYVTECHERGRHTLIYCATIKSCKMIEGTIKNLLPEDEWDTVKIITGKTDAEVRRKTLSGFADGRIRCIINCAVLTEGTDLPICDAIISVRPTCNISLYQQIVGRGTRLYDGKDYCLVIDIIPNDERKIRNLCTAPTLFGIDPSLLEGRVLKRINKENDLMELCDEIAKTIDSATEISKMIEVNVELAESFVQGRTDILTGDGLKEQPGFKQAAERYNGFMNEMVADSSIDFKNIYVTVLPDENHRFLIKPDWYDEIFISNPDMLGNVTVDFHVVPPFWSINNKHFIGDMKIEDAVELVREYCTITPEYQWYSWNIDKRNLWRNSPATENQKGKLINCYKKYGFSPDTMESLNKLEASTLIDLQQQIKEKEKFVKEHKLNDRQRTETRTKRINAFLEEKNMESKEAEKGKLLFPEFKDRLHSAYAVRKKKLDAAAEEKKKEAVKLAQLLGQMYLDIRIQGKKSEVPPSERQMNYIISMMNEVRGNGYIFEDGPWRNNMTVSNASVLIEILLFLKKLPKQREQAIEILCDSLCDIMDKAQKTDNSIDCRMYFRRSSLQEI